MHVDQMTLEQVESELRGHVACSGSGYYTQQDCLPQYRELLLKRKRELTRKP